MLHLFPSDISQIALPDKFTNPFNYTPHPLSLLAVRELVEYIERKKEWSKELLRGKMFGVLVIETLDGEVGYLTAFSGNLDAKNNHPYFVPPIYDMLQPDGLFKIEEQTISNINTQIKELESAPTYTQLQEQISAARLNSKQQIEEAKKILKEAKQTRERTRQEFVSPEVLVQMVKDSQFQKAELKRLERSLKCEIEEMEESLATLTNKIDILKQERKQRSADLQKELFNSFQILNGYGQSIGLHTLFEQILQKQPPAGAGECAAPKLLQHAFLMGLKPIAMAEFWWGNSPSSEIRHHGEFYPSCRSKCEPILKYMLRGVNIEEQPQLSSSHLLREIEILHEDQWLVVVNKPSGLLSVPGKSDEPSIYSYARDRYPDATGAMIVHRLDMATSGIILIAKSSEVHKHLQSQFKNRTIKKRYIALLDGEITNPSGVIDLPLCLDPEDRPHQIVNYEYGKQAITRYEVMEYTDGRTRIALHPLTGRTHQLRVHMAHPRGLATPIVGDELYGRKSDRLHLHAEQLEFQHPITKRYIIIENSAPF